LLPLRCRPDDEADPWWVGGKIDTSYARVSASRKIPVDAERQGNVTGLLAYATRIIGSAPGQSSDKGD
jgi:hypothetical protein